MYRRLRQWMVDILVHLALGMLPINQPPVVVPAPAGCLLRAEAGGRPHVHVTDISLQQVKDAAVQTHQLRPDQHRLHITCDAKMLLQHLDARFGQLAPCATDTHRYPIQFLMIERCAHSLTGSQSGHGCYLLTKQTEELVDQEDA